MARREHTLGELANKLYTRFDDAAIVKSVLCALCEQRLVDDTRASETYIAQQVARRFGELKIRAGLLRKQVDRQCIDRQLVAADVDWCALAHAALVKKFGCCDLSDRQRRFLMGRGFSARVIGDLARAERD